MLTLSVDSCCPSDVCEHVIGYGAVVFFGHDYRLPSRLQTRVPALPFWIPQEVTWASHLDASTISVSLRHMRPRNVSMNLPACTLGSAIHAMEHACTNEAEETRYWVTHMKSDRWNLARIAMLLLKSNYCFIGETLYLYIACFYDFKDNRYWNLLPLLNCRRTGVYFEYGIREI